MEMKNWMIDFVVVLVMLLAIVEISEGDTFCVADRDNFFNSCRPAATWGRPSPPTPACCRAISKLDLKCLCEFKYSPFLPSFGLDPPLTLAIPAKCGLRKPPC
ncbi:hypothetical protein Droror1_Dr00003887 [Drosera rotundifolia]